MALVRSPRMRAAERREQLLDVTLDLVVERGFHAVTIEAVAQAAGVTRPIVYKQFTHLSGLVVALIDREEDRAISQLARAIPDIPGDRDPDDLLVEGLQLYLEAVQEAPKTWQLILLPPEGVPAIFAERTNRTRRNVLRQLEKLVAWGIKRRGGPTNLDSELFARLLMEMAEDSARLILTLPEKFTIERIVSFARTLMGAGERGAHPRLRWCMLRERNFLTDIASEDPDAHRSLIAPGRGSTDRPGRDRVRFRDRDDSRAAVPAAGAPQRPLGRPWPRRRLLRARRADPQLGRASRGGGHWLVADRAVRRHL